MLRPSNWVRWGYWWFFGAIGCFTPFITLYYRNLGFNGLEIGILAALSPLGAAFLAPLWGSLADSWSAHRQLLGCSLVVAAGAALLMTQASQFWHFLPLVAALASALAAVPSLIDSYAVTVSERDGISFGRIRIAGSFGYILAIWVVARWMGQSLTTAFLYAYAGALLLAAVAALGLPALQPRSQQSFWRGVTAVVRDRAVALMLLTAFLVNSNTSLMHAYFGIYVIEIGGDAQLLASASALAAVSELPIMLLGARLLERLTSRWVLLIAIATYVVRFALYSVPPTPGLLLPIQLLHGMSFGAFLMASVTLIHQLAGRERAATAQGVLAAFSAGFGAITGSLVGGSLLDRIGAIGVMRVAMAGMALALAVGAWGTWERRARQPGAALPAQEERRA